MTVVTHGRGAAAPQVARQQTRVTREHRTRGLRGSSVGAVREARGSRSNATEGSVSRALVSHLFWTCRRRAPPPSTAAHTVASHSRRVAGMCSLAPRIHRRMLKASEESNATLLQRLATLGQDTSPGAAPSLQSQPADAAADAGVAVGAAASALASASASFEPLEEGGDPERNLQLERARRHALQQEVSRNAHLRCSPHEPRWHPMSLARGWLWLLRNTSALARAGSPASHAVRHPPRHAAYVRC